MGQVDHPELNALLQYIGLPLEFVFLMADDGENAIVGFWDPDSGAGLINMEFDDHAPIIKAQLRQMNVRRFATLATLLDTAKEENWPGASRFAT